MTEGFELGTDGPKVILVGVDDSVTSLRAGAYAAGLARRQRAKLVVVYVERVSSMSGAAAPSAPAAIVAETQALQAQADDLRRRTEYESERIGMDPEKVEFISVQGNPGVEIPRLADEVRADAVVVGASTKAGHRFVGSLAIHLVKLGRWPVTVVP